MGINQLELKLEHFADKIDRLYTTMGNLLQWCVDSVLSLGDFMVKLLSTTKDASNKIIDNEIYKRFRILTFPWHFLWILSYLLSRLKQDAKLIYDKPGVHIIIGPPGCGKSSLLFMLIERLRMLFGKASFINSDFEKARLSEDKQYKFRYHFLYKFTDFWRDRKMIQKPNHYIASSLVIDEGHRILNYRENGSTEYNDKFKPFMDYAVLVRKFINLIYFSTQMGKVDIQLMSLAQSITQPRVDIGFDYPDWLLETGAFRVKILGFYIDQYGLDINGEKTQKPIKSFYIKNEWADFDYFDTMAMNDVYDHVPTYKPKNMIKERVIQS